MIVQRCFWVVLLHSQLGAAVGCLSPELVCDGSADDTAALQTSIDACAAAQEPLVVPAGQSCITGPLTLRAGLTLHLPKESRLIAGKKWNSTAPDYTHFLTCEGGCHDLTISGSGTVDGRGSQWWPLFPHDDRTRPCLLFCDCLDVVVEGVTLRDSARFFMVVLGQRWKIHNVTIRSPGYLTAPNTDGIQVSAQDVHVSGCDVENGDDSIVIKPGARRVLVEDCRVGVGLGLVVGTGGDVHDVVFRRCVVDGTQYGCHIKAKDAQVGDVSNITFEDIEIKSVRNTQLINPWYAIGINQNGQTRSLVRYRNVTFRNIRCTGPCSGTPNLFGNRLAGHFICNPGDLACTGIALENVHLDAGCSFENVYGTGVDVQPASCDPSAGIDPSYSPPRLLVLLVLLLGAMLTCCAWRCFKSRRPARDGGGALRASQVNMQPLSSAER